MTETKFESIGHNIMEGSQIPSSIREELMIFKWLNSFHETWLKPLGIKLAMTQKKLNENQFIRYGAMIPQTDTLKLNPPSLFVKGLKT